MVAIFPLGIQQIIVIFLNGCVETALLNYVDSASLAFICIYLSLIKETLTSGWPHRVNITQWFYCIADISWLLLPIIFKLRVSCTLSCVYHSHITTNATLDTAAYI